MKSPVARLLPVLQSESRTAIEKRAAVELNPEIIRVLVFEAARKGQEALRIRIPDSLNVHGTEAKARLEAWCKDNALRLTWETRDVTLDDGRRATVFEPEISWVAQQK